MKSLIVQNKTKTINVKARVPRYQIYLNDLLCPKQTDQNKNSLKLLKTIISLDIHRKIFNLQMIRETFLKILVFNLHNN